MGCSMKRAMREPEVELENSGYEHLTILIRRDDSLNPTFGQSFSRNGAREVNRAYLALRRKDYVSLLDVDRGSHCSWLKFGLRRLWRE